MKEYKRYGIRPGQIYVSIDDPKDLVIVTDVDKFANHGDVLTIDRRGDVAKYSCHHLNTYYSLKE